MRMLTTPELVALRVAIDLVPGRQEPIYRNLHNLINMELAERADVIANRSRTDKLAGVGFTCKSCGITVMGDTTRGGLCSACRGVHV